MDWLEIDAAELRAVIELLSEAEQELADLESEDALQRATLLAHQLPVRIRRCLNDFRLERMSGVLRISGYEVDQERLGPTPRHWRERQLPSPAHQEEMLLILFGSLLGDAFAWATQQDGRLIHDIVPIRGHENEQMGSSSESLLTWHTEDAFHPLRGDFLGLCCLRNPNRAATTVGFVDDLDLPAGVVEILSAERFIIRPDEAHLPKNNSSVGQGTFDGVGEMMRNPAPVAVLFGDPSRPYVRTDPYFMTVPSNDQEAQAALDELIKSMDDLMVDLKLESGDFCFLDNYRVVHGRKPFKARHDGTDRWLKRINITNDLRKSKSARVGNGVRAIH